MHFLERYGMAKYYVTFIFIFVTAFVTSNFMTCICFDHNT